MSLERGSDGPAVVISLRNSMNRRYVADVTVMLRLVLSILLLLAASPVSAQFPVNESSTYVTETWAKNVVWKIPASPVVHYDKLIKSDGTFVALLSIDTAGNTLGHVRGGTGGMVTPFHSSEEGDRAWDPNHEQWIQLLGGEHQGETSVTLANAPGGATDWLVLTTSSNPDTPDDFPTGTYVGGGVTTRTRTVNMPATADQYELRLFLNGRYVQSATSPTITATDPTPVTTTSSPRTASVSAPAAPVLYFTDLAGGPRSGNGDTSKGQSAKQNGALVTVWGANLGTSRGM